MSGQEHVTKIDPALAPDRGPLHKLHAKGPEPEPLPEPEEEPEAGQ